MRFHMRILFALFFVLGLFIVCFNIVETVSGLMDILCWLLPSANRGYDGCGRAMVGHNAPLSLWSLLTAKLPVLSTQTTQLPDPSSIEDLLINASPDLVNQPEISVVQTKTPTLDGQQPKGQRPPPVDFGCKPDDTPDPETGFCTVLYADDEEDYHRKVMSAFAAGHRFFIVKITEEPLEEIDTASLAVDSADPSLAAPLEIAELQATQTLFRDIHLPTVADLSEFLHANHPREAVTAEASDQDGSCGGDYRTCGYLHLNCCHKKQPCCGLGCCPEGWHCEDLGKGVCCQDGLVLCGDFCVAGQCCPGGFACVERGETCCGVGGIAPPDDEERWHPGHQCCKRGEYCHGGMECRVRPGEISGSVRVAVGDALGRAYMRLFG